MIDQYPETASERHASAARPVQKPLPIYFVGHTEAVSLRTQGAFLRPRSVRAGQHNRRVKDLPTRAAAPPTQRAHHGRLS